jgi:hypothetical protein
MASPLCFHFIHFLPIILTKDLDLNSFFIRGRNMALPSISSSNRMYEYFDLLNMQGGVGEVASERSVPTNTRQ